MKFFTVKMIKAIMMILTITSFSCSNESDINLAVDNSKIPKSELKLFFDNTGFKDLDYANNNFSRGPGDPPCKQCLEDCSISIVVASKMTTEENILNAFSEDMKLFRDRFLLQGETGVAYKNAYYELSYVLLNQNLPTVSDIVEQIKIIPTVTQIFNRLSDKNFSGPVITENQKIELLRFIEIYNQKIRNSNLSNQDIGRYLTIIGTIKTDLGNITNKTNNQILNFLQE